jgi:hypothetical protein
MLSILASVFAPISRLIAAGVSATDLIETHSIIGSERTARIIRFIQRQDESITKALWVKYSTREIEVVGRALEERQNKIESAIRTAKRAVVLSYNLCPVPSVDGNAYLETMAYLQTGRYGTSDGPRAILDGPYSVRVANQMAEVKAGRNANAALLDPRF